MRDLALRVGTIAGFVCVFGVISFLISSLMSHLGGPGVDWGSPGAVSLNGDVVNASDYSNESTFSKVGSPRVSDNPVLGTIFNTKSND